MTRLRRAFLTTLTFLAPAVAIAIVFAGTRLIEWARHLVLLAVVALVYERTAGVWT